MTTELRVRIFQYAERCGSRLFHALIAVVRDSGGTLSLGLAGHPETEGRSPTALDGKDRFTRDDIRIGGLGKREEKVLRGKPR